MRKALLLAASATLLGAALIARGGSAASGPTYYKDVAPILDEKCASCHRLGGIAPFSLTTAAAAQAHAAGIVRMTKAGLMPPWMPGDDSQPLVGRDLRRLTASELATLAAWSAGGHPPAEPQTAIRALGSAPGSRARGRRSRCDRRGRIHPTPPAARSTTTTASSSTRSSRTTPTSPGR